jgi:DNA polymerase-3 subunit delta'
LHFIFPTVTSEGIKEPKSDLYQDIWRENIIEQNGYVSQDSWNKKLGVSGNKQGIIYSRDASDIIKTLNVKSYEAEYKVVIIYLAEKLHLSASNKLLKTLEEPPEKSLIIMVSERYELIIPTVRSRAQLLKIPPLKDRDIRDALVSKDILPAGDDALPNIVALAHGNWNKALQLAANIEEEQYNFKTFRDWTRLCFKPGNFTGLITFSKELARLPKNRQKNLLVFGMQVLHNSMLVNAALKDKIRTLKDESDYIEKFAPLINDSNRDDFYRLLNDAVYHLERNVNANIMFIELSIQMVILLNRGKKALKQ